MKHSQDQNSFSIYTEGKCDPKACVQGDCYRFTLLTERIIRLEYDPSGTFEDRPSQTVLFRNLPVPEFHVRDTGERLEIHSRHFNLTYHYGQEKQFTENSLVIDAKNNFTNYGASWHFGATQYGDPPRHHNLYGTARTLDRANGAVALERGLMDTSGHSFFDDSETALIEKDGTLAPRKEGTIDCYYVCCQHDYIETLQDFYLITGKPPMLPRYALGNWWSRYYKYTEESYMALLDRFEKEDVPFSVAVLDMDWHVTEVDPKYGKGWTGYTWNRDYFPNPQRFLETLHDRGFHSALNLHPADGVQGFEDAYPEMAKITGADPEKEEPVPFDLTDSVFRNAYFDVLLHPHEEAGADIWWIDWQQGRKCAVKNVDPLWLLNHYHYLDSSRNEKRGLILSRYAGLGSHRYPAGFSGDTISTWESLDFQAYFTLTAVNAGFPFWSHDIGGFTGGDRDPELFVRWLQLGTFSQFLRLHSNSLPFVSKEPWNFGKTVKPIICDWLRLRHKLIPYLYTETWRQNQEGITLIRPAYYDYPDENRAYSLKNQYSFGSQLLICPITSPADPVTGLASVTAWIPDGVYTDFFTGKTYAGSRVTTLNRSIEEYPVLAKPGAIVPTALMAKGSNSTENPKEMEIFVFPGASNSYTLFEDDGESQEFRNGKAYYTEFCLDWENRRFTISGHGDESFVPESRSFTITFRGFDNFLPVGEAITGTRYDADTRSVIVQLKPVALGETICIDLPGAQRETNLTGKERSFEFLNLSRLELGQKTDIYKMIEQDLSLTRILDELLADRINPRVIEVLNEILTD